MTPLKKAYRQWKKDTYGAKRWNIGFVDFNDATLFNPLNISWLRHDRRTSWFADPFILARQGNWLTVLAEEFVLARGKGIISKLLIEKTHGRYHLRETTPVLADDSHFSFPHIQRHDDRIFIIPENWESGACRVYHYDVPTDRVTVEATLCEDTLVDAVLCHDFGPPVLFATREGHQPCGHTLEIYRSSTGDWRGPYSLADCHVFPEQTARSGGHCFHLDGRLVRVAQNNNKHYGGGLVFYETTYRDGQFNFREIARHYPNYRTYHLGLHTFNVLDDIAAVDGRGYAHPFKRFVYHAKRGFRMPGD